MRRGFLLVPLLLFVLVPAAQAQTVHSWQLGPGGEATMSDPNLVDAEEHVPGQRHTWTLDLSEDYAVLALQVAGALPVERPRQAVPLLDGKHFIQVPFDPSEVDQPARVYSLEGDAGNFTYRLGLPGPGRVNLTLALDTEPPGFTLGPVERVTHFSFYTETRTTEAALATLTVHPPEGEPVLHPTPDPALLQRFPVQGLEPETTYTIELSFADWSGNEARAEPFTVRTQAVPERPRPNLTIAAPVPNATVPAEDLLLHVRIESPDSPIPPGAVRLFFDKREVTEAATVTEGAVHYAPPGPLESRRYSASVEVTNEAGGTAEVRWSFTVEGPTSTPLAPLLALVALAGAALVRACR